MEIFMTRRYFRTLNQMIYKSSYGGKVWIAVYALNLAEIVLRILIELDCSL